MVTVRISPLQTDLIADLEAEMLRNVLVGYGRDAPADATPLG
jgi:hypothetical protein